MGTMRRRSSVVVFCAIVALGAWWFDQPALAETTSQPKPAAATHSETARLNEWFAARWKEQLDFSPIRRTFLGLKEDYDKIDDFSESAADAQLAWRRQATADLKESFEYARLSSEGKMSYDIWIYQTERAERALPFRRRGYVFTQMQGPQAFLPQFLIAFHRVDTPADMQAYITRIGAVARGIDQLLERAKLAAAEGLRPPRFAYEGVLSQSRALITGAPFAGDGDTPLWADVKSEIETLEKADKIDAGEAERLREAARKALVERFKPSYDALIAWIDADMKNTDAQARGVGSLPDGRELYQEALASSTTTSMTADQIHEFGLTEVARLRAEIEAVQKVVGFKGGLPEFFAFLREDSRFFFPSTDEGREAYLQAARDHLAFINKRLPEYFGILPKASLEVKRVEAFREQPGAAQHYFPGTPDGSRPGVYYAHLIDMKAMPKHELEVIAYHEGSPGHHMQVSIAQELQDVPTFRTQAGFTAYSEGWGLYAELLAKEMGAYKDPYSELGRLSSEIWRAIRLVLDTGIHAKGWTEQQCVDYFTQNSPAASGAIRSEVQRYFVMPGQATAYKVGMQKIQDLRAKAEAALGDRFDIRGFHDTVLGGGAMPLETLERRVDEWIARTKAG
jgi:uncharacterized protein (DUF885 family)